MFKRTLMASAGLLALSLSAGSAVAQHDHPQHGTADQLGKVDFANSCKPEVQDELGQAVALLHSFWYNLGETSRLPSFQTAPKISAKTGFPASMRPNCFMSGRNRIVGMLGMSS